MRSAFPLTELLFGPPLCAGRFKALGGETHQGRVVKARGYHRGAWRPLGVGRAPVDRGASRMCVWRGGPAFATKVYGPRDHERQARRRPAGERRGGAAAKVHGGTGSFGTTAGRRARGILPRNLLPLQNAQCAGMFLVHSNLLQNAHSGGTFLAAP